MADPAPFEYGDDGLSAGHPSRLLRALKDKIPENKSGKLSGFNIVRDALGTAANWLNRTPEVGKDTLGPLGGAGLMAAGLTKPVPNAVSAFIGPAQVSRLGLSEGSHGSLGALEKAQRTWYKGGTTPEGLAETWSKHGWAPPEAFGVRGRPFSWLEMPDLRLRDDVLEDHALALSQGRMHTTDGNLVRNLETGPDLDRLLQAEPRVALMNMGFRTAPGISYQGSAGYAGKKGETLPLDADTPLPNYVMGMGPDANAAESIMIGHELRGHAMPHFGGTQQMTLRELMRNGMPNYDTPAADKLMREIEQARARSNALYADPKASSIERSAASRWVDTLKEMKDQAASHAAYFARPEEKMARHAHMLDQIERGGGSPFRADRAPGVMSTYGERGIISDKIFDELTGAEGIYKLRDLMPRSKRLTEEDLAPFMAVD